MSGSTAPYFRPKWAVIAWVDDTNVYVEIPSKEGPPYIHKESLSENGLYRALNLMKKAYAKDKPASPFIPQQRFIMVKRGKVTAPEVYRQSVRDILRKRGLI